MKPVLAGLGLYFLTRRLKQKAAMDFIYFFVPFALINYGQFLHKNTELFELSFPPHPFIMQKRMEAINAVCY